MQDNVFGDVLYWEALLNNLYHGAGIKGPNQTAAISQAVMGGYEAWPNTDNSVWVGHLQYFNSAAVGTENILTLVTAGINRKVDTLKDQKLFVFEYIRPDSGLVMGAPVMFQGWVFAVTGRGAIP